MKNINTRLQNLERKAPAGPIWCRILYFDALTGVSHTGPRFDITKPAPPEVIEYRKTLGDDNEKQP